jgi:predicted nucleic acid-binding protein
VILVDTSVWIDHFRAGDALLSDLLNHRRVLGHRFVLGEIALGMLRQRDLLLSALQDLPQAVVAHDDEVLRLIGQEDLAGSGIGYVDAHLLAAVRLTADATLWTRDRRLKAAASRLFVAARLLS